MVAKTGPLRTAFNHEGGKRRTQKRRGRKMPKSTKKHSQKSKSKPSRRNSKRASRRHRTRRGGSGMWRLSQGLTDLYRSAAYNFKSVYNRAAGLPKPVNPSTTAQSVKRPAIETAPLPIQPTSKTSKK